MENSEQSSLFLSDAQVAIQNYPGLQFIAGSPAGLAGTIVLHDDAGNSIDTYQVRIKETDGYPYYFPYVYETGGQIPINTDWHVYESDGHLCLATTTDEYIKTANGLRLPLFIQDELIPYLYNQTHRRLSGFFLHEMAHGEQGELATLKNLLKTNEIANIHWILHKIKNGWHIERTSICFCNSKLKYRYCHRNAIDQIKAIGPQKLQTLINMVENTSAYQLHNLRPLP